MANPGAVSVRSGGELIAYASIEPYEVCCVRKGRDRFSAILTDTPIAIQLPHRVEADTRLPEPPKIKPISAPTRVKDFLLDVDATTGFELADTQTPVEILRDRIDAPPIETEKDIPAETALYTAIREAITTVSDSNPDAPEPYELQRSLQAYLSRMSLSPAVSKLEAEYGSAI